MYTLESGPTAWAVGTDMELFAGMARGERGALAALYDRYSGTLMALAIHLVRETVAAEELLHDVFLAAWTSKLDYQPSRGPLIGWFAARMIQRRRRVI